MGPASHVTCGICWYVIFSDQVHGRAAGPRAPLLPTAADLLICGAVDPFLAGLVIDGGGLWSTVVRGGEKKGPTAHFGGGLWR